MTPATTRTSSSPSCACSSSSSTTVAWTPGDAGCAGKAPLWFYILREAEIKESGRRLGPVGARLITDVILGILNCDKNSYLNARTPFRPTAPIAPAGTFTMGDLTAFAQDL